MVDIFLSAQHIFNNLLALFSYCYMWIRFELQHNIFANSPIVALQSNITWQSKLFVVLLAEGLRI